MAVRGLRPPWLRKAGRAGRRTRWRRVIWRTWRGLLLDPRLPAWHRPSSRPAPSRRWPHGLSAGGASAALLLLLPEGGTLACGLPAILHGHGSSLQLVGRGSLDLMRREVHWPIPETMDWTGLAREEAPEPRPIHL